MINPQNSKGHRKILAQCPINMKNYASPMPTQTQLKLKLKPTSKKIVSATLTLTLSCVFIRDGKATYGWVCYKTAKFD